MNFHYDIHFFKAFIYIEIQTLTQYLPELVVKFFNFLIIIMVATEK